MRAVGLSFTQGATTSRWITSAATSTPDDLRRAARTFHQNEIGLATGFRKAFKHLGHQPGFQIWIVAGIAGGEYATLDNDLRADLGLRLEQHRIHVDRRRHAARPRLQRLRPADLATVGGHGGIVAHVLRLERPHRQTAPDVRPAEPGHEQRLANVRPGALEHQGGHAGHQEISTRRRAAPSRRSGTGA
jgi:hypothetical protein